MSYINYPNEKVIEYKSQLNVFKNLNNKHCFEYRIVLNIIKLRLYSQPNNIPCLNYLV